MSEPERVLPGASPGEPPSLPSQGTSLLGRTFSAFRYRNFRILWLGAFTSTTGTWMQIVAESWLVLSLTGSAFYLGLTGFLGELPVVLFSLIGGVVADRAERRRLLLGSQYVQMAAAFILTFLVWFDFIQVWHLLLFVFITGTARSFGGPAYQALIPGLVPRAHLHNAIALNSIQFNLARMMGPLIAGAALASVGAALCFGLNGVSFLAVIVSLHLIRVSFVPPQSKESLWVDMRRGLAFVRNRRDLWQLSILGFVSAFCGIPLFTLLPVFARDIFQMGPTGYSTMMAVSGAGAVAGALLYAGFAHAGRGRQTLYMQLLFALFLSIFAVSRNLMLSYLVLFLGGICLISLFASITSLVQLATSDSMRGRVISIFMLAFRGGMPLGNLFAGYAASQYSAPTSILILGVLAGLVAISFLFSRSPVNDL
jgi:predicted MFS family arabinose efflux permease